MQFRLRYRSAKIGDGNIVKALLVQIQSSKVSLRNHREISWLVKTVKQNQVSNKWLFNRKIRVGQCNVWNNCFRQTQDNSWDY